MPTDAQQKHSYLSPPKHRHEASWFADLFIIFIILSIVYGLTLFGKEWNAGFKPNSEIDLSISQVPIYALFSSLRGLFAYFVSLVFTLYVGYWAAQSPRAEKIILPILDIMQSIPVLGFLPGLVLGLVSIFPHTNTGLELASILMIFTGQVWNMTFAFYSSLKSIPTEMKEATSVMKLNPLQKLFYLELPYSAMNLTWNSVMSMAGGWFFLTVCEAFTLGDQTYRLPGLGAYMAVAIEKDNKGAIWAGALAMALVIILFDFLLWRPALVWAHRYRLEEGDTTTPQDPMMTWVIEKSWIAQKILHRTFSIRKKNKQPWLAQFKKIFPILQKLGRPFHFFSQKWIWMGLFALLIISIIPAALKLVLGLAHLPLETWADILTQTFWTLLRVLGALLIGTLWTTPIAIWVSLKPTRMQWAQPLIQMLASFPAPMLYPLAMGLFVVLKVNFEISSMLLMLLGVQWYIMFNVLAGATRIPNELRLSLQLMNASTWTRWRYLLIPSVLPSLVTGWVTAAGGAWNASIVSELIMYQGHVLKAHGLGALINQAAEKADFEKLAACLVVMVVLVILLNRTVWARLYRLTQTRFRLDM